MNFILFRIATIENKDISNIARSFPSKTQGMEYEHENQEWHFYRQLFFSMHKEYSKALKCGKDIHFFREVILDEKKTTKVYFYDSGDQIRHRIVSNAKRDTTILLLEEMNYRRKNESEIKREKENGNDKPNRFKRSTFPMEDTNLNSLAIFDTSSSVSIANMETYDMVKRIIDSMVESGELKTKEIRLLREICDDVPNSELSKQYGVPIKIIQQKKRRLQKKMANFKENYMNTHKE
ncbi:hypothetical protein JE286_001478 [Listeria monocytogenes]|nr:hypothetical protein [Listeria monocytogenes]